MPKLRRTPPTERIPVTCPEDIHYRRYQSSAAQRYIPFELPFGIFCELINLDCHYCGTEPHSTRILFQGQYYYFQGIDRVDSDLAYTVENCVPCCSGCNSRKGSMSVEKFKEREANYQKILADERLRNE